MINPNATKRVLVDVVPKGRGKDLQACYQGVMLEVIGNSTPGRKYMNLKYSIVLDQYCLTPWTWMKLA
jgi:hypothetical protein